MSGDVTNVIPACQTWEDYLWAHFSAIVESKLESRLYENSDMIVRLPEVSLPLPNYDLSENEIFESLARHENESIQSSALETFRLVQTHYILGSLDTMFQTFKEQLENNVYNDHAINNSLRFMTHLILFLRNLGLESYNPTTDYIILKYIQLLQNEQKVFFVDYLG